MKIAVLLGGTLPYTWRVAAGAIEYGIERDIQILLPYAELAGDAAKDPANWDGAIVRKPRPELDIPQVSISLHHRGDKVSVTFNESLVVKSAIDQFITMGLRNLAFFGSPNWPVSQHRWHHFCRQVEDLGEEPLFIDDTDKKETLLKMPKPCGIMAFNDDLALMLLERCRKKGLRVPGDTYIITADDTQACLLSSPTLSSISMPFHIVGYHAARLCAELINGNSVDSIEVPPSGLIIRESVALESEDMRTTSQIAHYLRSHLSHPIQMMDVVSRSNMSRRRLEQVFRSAYGTSPMAYLKEHRLKNAKRLLRTTDASVKNIADACGYRDSNQICRVFKERVGLTPLLYRKTHRDG